MATQFSEMIQSETPTLVDFSAEWCGPCKMMKPILADLKARIGDKARVIQVDVDRNQQIASDLQIRGVPTLILYQSGEIKWRQSGVVQPGVLEEIILRYAQPS